MNVDQIIEFISKLGLPISLVGVFILGFYKVSQWCGVRFDQWIKPLLDKHFSLVDSLNESTKTNTQTLKDHAQLLTEFQIETIGHQKAMSQRLVDVFEELKEHRKKTENDANRNTPNKDIHQSV